MKKFIKNYRNNNLPETLFLIGVLVLSIGLFIEPKSSWLLGIYFYKSDLTTITTISKILGTLIMSYSIILNLKKYTNKDNNNLNEYNNVSEEKKLEEEPKIDIEKLKRSLIKTGKSVSAIGWLMIIISIGVFLWSIFDNNFSESGLSKTNYSTLFIVVVNYVVFIILGNRIKNLVDRKIKLYIQIILLLSFVFLVFIMYTGGTVGILFFLLTGYLISSLTQISKAMKVKAFTSTLTDPEYKLDKKGWIIFAVVSIVLFFVLLNIDLSESKIDWEKEYGTNKSDLSYETYLKEKDGEKTSDAWAEFDKQKIIPSTKTETNKINISDMPNWITYTSKEDGFSILLPNEPIISKASNDFFDTTYFSSSNNGILYGIFKFNKKSGIDDTDDNLKIAPELVISNYVSGKLLYSDYGYYNNNRVFNFTGSLVEPVDSETIKITGRSLIVDNISFVLVIYHKDDYDKKNYLNFINSFKTF